MTTHRFYIKEKSRESAFILLEGHEHHHLSRVARIMPGEEVWLFDDEGNQYRALVEEIQKKKTRLFILEKHPWKDPNIKILLAQVILKTKNMDLVIQKATELGADAIIPVISGRTVVKVGDAQTQKRERWKRLAIEASKQCGRSAVPDIMISSSLRTFIPKNRGAKKIFLSEHGGASLKEMLMSPLEKKTGSAKSVILLVGPEGGWTEIEEQDIMKNQFEAVSLGSLTLRAETAAIVSLAMVSQFWKNEDVSKRTKSREI